MISTLELKQFRGLEHVKFGNLGRVNLIMGGNNAGKTSILEALGLLYGNKKQLTALPTTFRVVPNNTIDLGNSWKQFVRSEAVDEMQIEAGVEKLTGKSGKASDWLYVRSSVSSKIESIAIKIDKNGRVNIRDDQTTLNLSILSTKQENPTVVSDLYSRIAPLNPANEVRIEELLRNSIEPRLRQLRYAPLEGSKTHIVHVGLGEGKMIPFTQMGQAFARTLQVYCEIFAQRPKILLIDEIENGLYYEGMEDYWKGLMAVLEDQDVQLFATTHSRECMEAAYRAAKDIPSDPLRYLRLDRRIDDPTKIVATTFGKAEMATAIEFNLEMR